jgi:fructuronate reductase
MKDVDLVKLVEIIGYKEGLPVVVNPGILSPKAFIDEVLKVRVPNPFMPDTPQRIACDTSQKIPIRFGETIKAYIASDKLNVRDLKLIPLALAAWVRYLLGVDDTGAAFTISPDPMLDTLTPKLAGIKLGESVDVCESKLEATTVARDFHKTLEPILSDSKIFAVNLYEAGLGQTVEGYFAELVAGPGAVRKTLHKYTA